VTDIPDAAVESDQQVARPVMPLVTRCLKCRHEWIAVYLSLSVADTARVLAGTCCPACGVGSAMIGFAK
jgi:hypothetical protein